MNLSLYETRGGDAKFNAQANLNDRTHYVDDDTLRFHKARVLETYVVDNGLLFALIESVALDYHNTRRGFRYVVFDICGNVVSRRVSLEECFKTREAARRAMWEYLNTADAKAITRDALDRAERFHCELFADARAKLEGV